MPQKKNSFISLCQAVLSVIVLVSVFQNSICFNICIPKALFLSVCVISQNFWSPMFCREIFEMAVSAERLQMNFLVLRLEYLMTLCPFPYLPYAPVGVFEAWGEGWWPVLVGTEGDLPSLSGKPHWSRLSSSAFLPLYYINCWSVHIYF